jgi:hypothetical protein
MNKPNLDNEIINSQQTNQTDTPIKPFVNGNPNSERGNEKPTENKPTYGELESQVVMLIEDLQNLTFK